MENPADKHIVRLIQELCDKSTRYSERNNMQMYVNQIAQLRASMNPVIHMKKNKD